MNKTKQPTTKPISPKKKFVLSILDLAKNDPEIGALQPNPELRKAAIVPDMTLDRMIAIYLDGYGDRRAVAERSYEMEALEDGKKARKYLPSYTAISYNELSNRIKAVANAWRHHPTFSIQPKEFVAIIGFTSIDFAVLDYACAFAHTVTIPMQSSTSGADLSEIFGNTEPAALAASINDLVLAAEHATQQPSIRSLIAFDYEEKADKERAQFERAKKILLDAGGQTQLISLKELITYGAKHDFSFLPPHKDGGDRMTGIIHSSGSTGKPKGAIMPERAIMHTWLGKATQVPKVTLMFAPQNHIMGRNALINTLNNGGTAYFTLKPDMSTLFEDIRLARPTFLTFFPRAFELIYQDYQNEVARRMRAGETDKKAVQKAVQAEMKYTYLGDRLRGGVVGSAPTSPAVRDFIRDCFDILLMDGYGNTESGTGSVTIDGIIDRTTVLDYKLTDVPELGYYTTDKPFPRGELCIKSRWGITGYYKQPEATKGLFDEEGFSLTGDIVEERKPDHLVVIDRRKDVLKLSQGEYVAVGTLGTVFEAESAVIKQIYIYGNSLRAYLLAVIVPEMKVVESILSKPNFKSISENQLKGLIREELQKVAQKEGLKSFEVPRDFIIEMEHFSQKNGLLSSVRKRLRPALKKKYAPQLEALYAVHEQGNEAELLALKDPNSSLTVLERLVKLLEANLGIKGIDLTKKRTFTELGGDSLEAVMFSNIIDEFFEVNIPANTLLSPTGHPQHWAALIEKAQSQSESNQPNFKTIHGKNAKLAYAKDLQLARFLGQEIIATAATLAEIRAVPNTVLLTGANGFLGHILCLTWLERVAKTNGKVICIIRAADDQAARQRLDKAFHGKDAEMETLYKQLSAQHLEVFAGDIAETNFGLSPAIFQRLSTEVDRICHPAALVNHRFEYAHLFGPNVIGTAEIIRLAITHHKKPIDFISSVAVERYLETSQINNEASPLLPQVKLSGHYAAGYGISKWAAEHLLKNANETFGIPVNVFRSDMILAHQTYKGQINSADMLTRLLFSIITTSLAPVSFYQKNKDGQVSKAHYDGVPVDVIAKAVVEVCDTEQTGLQVFNVQNYHQNDGVSLDSFVDWIISAGYKVQRLDKHKKWFERMQDKLNTLPDEQKQQSALDILVAYSRPYPPASNPAGCDNFKGLIQTLNAGADIPHLSETYIHKCLADMRLLRILD